MLSKLRRLLYSGLRRLPRDAARGRVASSHPRARPSILFAFHGGNKARPGMGHRFYREEEAFRRAIRRCAPAVERRMGFSLTDVFEGREGWESAELEEAERQNIVILSALELGLCDLWRDYGVEPGGAVGVSGGEVAAAYAAGAFELEEATEILCSVARLVTQSPSKGYFVWLDVDFETALELARLSPAPLEIFMELSPRTSLAYCTAADFAEVGRFVAGRGVGHRAAETDWAHHTPWAARALDAMGGELYAPRPRPLASPLYSSLTGGVFSSGAVLDAGYWYAAAVSPIMFGRATCAALAGGHQVILNASNHPTLKAGIAQSAETLGAQTLMLDTMRRGEPELSTWNEALRALSAAGLTGGRRGVAVRVGNDAAGGAAYSAAAGLDLSRPDVVRDPYPHYAALRRSGSVHFLEQHGFWLVLGYGDVAHALKQPSLFPSARASAHFDPVLVEADPPDHTRVRRILSPYFSPQSFRALEGYAKACAGELLARAGRAGDFDLVDDFAVPLTELVLARFLGLPPDETQSLRRELGAYKFDIEGSSRVLDGWAQGYLGGLKDSRGEDLCSRLLRGNSEGRLTPEEVASVVKLLWLAGTDTTGMLIVSSALRLLRHPDVRAEVSGDPRALPAFVEEVLRLDSPQQLVARVTRKEVELSGVAIPAGASVRLCLGAANRDPACFAEPDALSLRRSPNNHLAFAAGPHFCMGALLARTEARVALESLLAAWPDFAPARPLSAVSYVASVNFRAVEHLHIKAV